MARLFHATEAGVQHFVLGFPLGDFRHRMVRLAARPGNTLWITDWCTGGNNRVTLDLHL